MPVETLEYGDLLVEPERLPIVPDALGGAEGVLGTDGLAGSYDRLVTMARPGLRALNLADIDPIHSRRVWRLMTQRLEMLTDERDSYLIVLSGASP